MLAGASCSNAGTPGVDIHSRAPEDVGLLKIGDPFRVQGFTGIGEDSGGLYKGCLETPISHLSFRVASGCCLPQSGKLTPYGLGMFGGYLMDVLGYLG